MRPVARGLGEVEYRILQAIHDLSAGIPTVGVTQKAAARKAGLDLDSGKVSKAMAALGVQDYGQWHRKEHKTGVFAGTLPWKNASCE